MLREDILWMKTVKVFPDLEGLGEAPRIRLSGGLAKRLLCLRRLEAGRCLLLEPACCSKVEGYESDVLDVDCSVPVHIQSWVVPTVAAYSAKFQSHGRDINDVYLTVSVQ